LLSYLVISFLIVINMYIAVILENYSQVCPLEISVQSNPVLRTSVNATSRL
jgi:hypothetical protein